MPRLAAHRGGPRLFIERGDCAGLAFGGNKPRHDGFPLGEALAQGAARGRLGESRRPRSN